MNGIQNKLKDKENKRKKTRKEKNIREMGNIKIKDERSFKKMFCDFKSRCNIRLS